MRAALLAMVLSSAAAVASAQNIVSSYDFLRVAQNLERSQRGEGASISTSEQSQIFVMLGIVQGIRETMDVFVALADNDRSSTAQLACIPQTVSTGQLILILKAEVEKAPSMLHHRFSIFAQDILHRTYPCRQGKVVQGQ